MFYSGFQVSKHVREFSKVKKYEISIRHIKLWIANKIGVKYCVALLATKKMVPIYAVHPRRFSFYLSRVSSRALKENSAPSEELA